MKFYLQVNEENIITDAINYPFEDYVEFDHTEEGLPAGVNGGWWKLEEGQIVEYPELKPIEEIEEK